MGLPLQISTFDRLWEAGHVLGVGDALPGGRFQAFVDSSGSMIVDEESIAAVRQAFPMRPSPSFISELERIRRERCLALSAATLNAELSANEQNQAELELSASRLLDAVAAVMPYPILTKFVPELLSEALTAGAGSADETAGTHVFPQPSIGSRLTRALDGLARWLASRGVSPETLLQDWSDADLDIRRAVEDFCRVHSGLGPVAWESPGFETPTYVLRTLVRYGAPQSSGSVEYPVFNGIEADDVGGPFDLEHVLLSWIRFTDLQIWYLRSAFYRGLVPLLRQLGKVRRLAPSLLLFVERDELIDGGPGTQTMTDRVVRYLADEIYLRAQGTDRARLDAVFDLSM